MINPLQGQPRPEPAGRGLGSLPGDEDLSMNYVPGDFAPGTPYAPGSMRMAGDKIKGLQQLDPTIFQKLFA